jgi:carboxypeptidase family protein
VSATVPLEVLPEPPVAVWPYIVSPALTLLAALVVFAARDRRWRRWLTVGRRARRIAAAAPRDLTAPGLAESRRGILSSLRRPDHGFSGVVVDAADDRPIRSATIVARAADGQPRAATVDERGRFAFEELPPGPLVVEVAAAGYVGERFARAIPHRGELRNARVRLVPVRARIFDAWRRAALPLYPTPRAAETMTPRELLGHVEKKRLVPSEPLIALTARVEAAVWGAAAPSTDDLAEVERLASALKADV